jgi:hypothetical protein
MVNCSLTRAIIEVNIGDSSSFTILIVVILTQYNIRARRGFKEDSKE